MLECFPYIHPPASADLMTAVRETLTRNGKMETYRHVCAVADVARALAEREGLCVQACEHAALLHDISAVIGASDMLAWMQSHGGWVADAERQHPFLLHQRISRVIASEDFMQTDERILSAIECHTTLKEAPSPYDLVVFLADKISWDRGGEPPYRTAVERELKHSLARAALAYIDFTMDGGMILCPHPWLLQARKWLADACA